MPFTAGVYAAPSSPGAFNQAVDGMPATPAAWNALLADMSTALSTCILKDGTQTVTANIPMNSHKFTGMVVGTAATDSATVGQVQSNPAVATTVGGTADAITLALSPAITSYTNGLRISFTVAASNTSTVTVDVNGVGARTLTTPAQAQMIANDLKINGKAVIEYNSATNTFQLISVTAPVTQNITVDKGDMWVYSGSGQARLARTPEGSVIISDGSVSVTGRRQVPALNSVIYGLTYQNNVGDAANDLDIAAGGCMDATGAYWLTLAALTKQTDANWAPGTNQGSLDTGTVGDSDYYIWAIARSDTGVTDILTSLSSTAPTMPTNYDFKRIIGWFKRTGGSIVAFKTYETLGGGLQLLWSSPTLDVNLAATLTTARRTDAVKVPLNITTTALLNVTIVDATGADVYIYCPDQADVAPGNTTTAPLATFRTTAVMDTAAGQLSIRTSATGTIAARASIVNVSQYSVATLGFTMDRRI